MVYFMCYIYRGVINSANLYATITKVVVIIT